MYFPPTISIPWLVPPSHPRLNWVKQRLILCHINQNEMMCTKCNCSIKHYFVPSWLIWFFILFKQGSLKISRSHSVRPPFCPVRVNFPSDWVDDWSTLTTYNVCPRSARYLSIPTKHKKNHNFIQDKMKKCPLRQETGSQTFLVFFHVWTELWIIFLEWKGQLFWDL